MSELRADTFNLFSEALDILGFIVEYLVVGTFLRDGRGDLGEQLLDSCDTQRNLFRSRLSADRQD